MNRQNQMENECAKLKAWLSIILCYSMNMKTKQIYCIGFISTKGAIGEGAERLERHGKSEYDAYSTITSFPKDIVQQAINKASKVIVAEHNYQGQLSSILK